MDAKKQFILSMTLAAAFVAASIVMPDTASANWWDWWKPNDRAVPEIDPSTIGSAIAIAVGGWAVLSDKLRRH